MNQFTTCCPDDKVEFGPSTTGIEVAGKIVKPKIYKKYNDNDVIMEALAFYILPRGTTLASYCNKNGSAKNGRKVPLSSMRRFFKTCNVFQMKLENVCVGDVEKVLKAHLAKTRDNAKNRTGPANMAKRYLTNNEEMAIVQIARLMGSCGAGVGKDELLDILNLYLHHHEDARLFEPATMRLVEQLMKRHKELIKLVSASSMDPQRAKQATIETRDAVFFKLDSYVKNLHAMGHCDWESFKDVPAEDMLNMDEVGADTTKHQKNVISDKKSYFARVFQETPPGDGKMNMHVTMCITTCGNGLFADTENKILGACAPVIIHCDKQHKQEKEDEERRKQRTGEKPSKRHVTPRFNLGNDVPEIKVLTTRNGSMTQETFDDYASHLINSLPEEHGPKILFLDGHGSRWNRQTLLFLMKNKIFPFFFASHTSIWAQPNDGGPNLRLHNCLEEAVRNRRRTGGTPDVTYFNTIICYGWRLFLERERQELRAKTTNTTRNSYIKSGVGEFNPYCEGWTTAIETTGRVLNNKKTAVTQYEPVAKTNARQLTLDEKETLREGIDFLDKDTDLGDIPVAILQAQRILANWREGVRVAVEEGEEENKINQARKPLPSNPSQRLALDIVDLVEVDVDAIELPATKTREAKAYEITRDIVRTSMVSDCIAVAYLSSSSGTETSSDEQSESESETDEETNTVLKGRAIKTDLDNDPDQNSWNVTVKHSNGSGRTFVVQEKELLGGEFVVEHAYNEKTAEQKKKLLAKNKRMRQKEARAQEVELAEIGRERRKELERAEYNNIVAIFRSGRTYESLEFTEMLRRMRKPFTCNVQGRDVTVTEADSAIMMEQSALDEIGKILVSNKRNAADTDNTQAKKRRQNNSACNTTRGATGFDAMHGAARRDYNENTKIRETQIKSFRHEMKGIKKLLTTIDSHKKSCTARYVAAVARSTAALKERRRREEGTGTATPEGVLNVDDEQTNVLNVPNGSRGETPNVPRTPNGSDGVGGSLKEPNGSPNGSQQQGVGPAGGEGKNENRSEEEMFAEETRQKENEKVSVPEYWQVLEKSTSDTMDLFLRVYVPKCGILNKNKPIKWMTLDEKVILMGLLTRTQFDSRVENLGRRLTLIQSKLAGFQQNNSEESLEPDELEEGVTLD